MEGGYIKVSVRGKLFYTTKEILKRSKYFQNLFGDTQVEDTIYLNQSPYAFEEILKYLENDLHYLPPEYYHEYDFFMLEFVEDKIVVKTKTMCHYFFKKYIEVLSEETVKSIKDNVLDVRWCEDSDFMAINHSLENSFALRPKYVNTASRLGIKYFERFEGFIVNNRHMHAPKVLVEKYNLRGRRIMDKNVYDSLLYFLLVVEK